MKIWEIESDLEYDLKIEIRKELTKFLDLRGDYTVSFPSDDYAYEYGSAAIDGSLIYTSDIHELWRELGRPDPETMSDYSTISDAITGAVYEGLMERIDCIGIRDNAVVDTWQDCDELRDLAENMGLDLDDATDIDSIMEMLDEITARLEDGGLGHAHTIH